MNTEKALVDYSTNVGVDYPKLYYHYAKGDTIPFDWHPNQLAHELIADTVEKYIQTTRLVETELH